MTTGDDVDLALRRLRDDALAIFRTGLDAASPEAALRRAFEPEIEQFCDARSGGGRLGIVAFGKASCAMAATVIELLDRTVFPGPGIAVVNDDNFAAVDRFEVLAAGHPLPDERGVRAALEVEAYARALGPHDRFLVLISGGGSALLPAPAPRLALDDKRLVTRLLLEAGAPIDELNAVRKHLSRLKGGGLARAAAPAAIDALIVSDVIGNDLATIASGPTAPDPTTFAEALAILDRRGIRDRVSRAVIERLEAGKRGAIDETPKPGDPVFADVRNEIIASNDQSLDACVARARALGYEVIVASRALGGEARAAGVALARALRSRRRGSPPLALLAGGETTVTVRGHGRGGRNQEMALAFALAAEELRLASTWTFLSGGTDGRDGPTDAAGAIVDPGTLARARRARLDPAAHLRENDSNPLLDAAGDLLRTGGTGTNVADLQVVLAAG